ncbi:MAG: LysR family transcriptional regulator [Oscillospiraceae bacterium]|nr:LysR family transcriptional regulator [Oscillospiraceae bacterium]MCI1990440.1 LysR family transcriptional regulator [Oscillospiraceae bacterium]MCI2036061.1 LysR family transcriptional regulator [Oscillospiraceae bacterium]
MDINKYAIFVLSAETGCLTRAAAQMHYTQTAASHMLASLETELGVRLLTRSHRGVAPTPAGEAVLPYARKIVENDRRIRQLTAPGGRQKGLVRIGAITSVAVRWLPEIMLRFRRKYPGIELELNDAANYEAIRDWFGQGRIDCAFAADAAADDMKTQQLCRDPFRVIFPAGHPLCRCEKIKPALLAGETFLVPSEGVHHSVGRILRQAKGRVPDTGRLSDRAAIAMVRRGCGVSILPELVLDCYSCEGIERRSLEPECFRTIYLAVPAGKAPLPAERAFLRFVRSWAEKLGA